jgi:hypothetical protein
VISPRLLASTLCLVSFATSANADVSPERAEKAALLFKEGDVIMASNTTDPQLIESACSKFEASYKLDPQIGTRLNLANCREQQGHHLEAFRLFEESLTEAMKSGKQGRADFARQRMDGLGAKLVKVSLRVSEETPELQITVGGSTIPRDRWSASITAAPGTIVVRASAPDREPVRLEREAAAGERVQFDIPALAVLPPSARRSKLPFIVGGAGVAAIGLSIGLGLHARSSYNDAKAAGDINGVESAQTEADIGTFFFIAGAAAVGAGAYLWYRDRNRDRVVVVPTASPTSAGLSVSRSF